MAFLADRVLDSGLTVLDTEANRIDICSTEPTSYAQATSTYTLGNKTGISVGAPEDAAPNGRRVVVAAITDGSVTGTGTAGFVAITDTVNSRLLAVQDLDAPVGVTSGNLFSLPAFSIIKPDVT
jgi:hypothetical protein